MFNFLQAIKLFFIRAFDFSGRSSRSEYWWSILFSWIAVVVLLIPAAELLQNNTNPETGEYIGGWHINFLPVSIFFMIILIPTLSITIRRFHDRNISGWYLLLFLVGGLFPIAGLLYSVVQIVIFCLRGTEGPNKYGPDPFGSGSKSRKALGLTEIREVGLFD